MVSEHKPARFIDNIYKWIESNEGFLHPSIVIQKSSISGYGLFTTTPLLEKTEIIRLRQNCVYGLESFDMMELFLLGSPLWKSEWTRISQILRLSKADVQFPKPQEYIRDCVWAFNMILNLKNLKVHDPLTDFKLYLEVLLNTPIADVDVTFESYDPVVESMMKEKHMVKILYDDLVTRYPDTTKLMSFDTAFQLHKAVHARLKDVPEESPLLQSYIALMPVLDFANHHSTQHNAKLKLDLASPYKDIIFVLERDILADQEILMQYYGAEDINPCMKTYGFVPQAPRSLVWEIPDFPEVVSEALGSFKIDHSLNALWLKCPHKIRLMEDKAGNVTFEADSFRLPLMLIPDMTRDPKGIFKLPDPPATDVTSDDEYDLLSDYSGSTAYGVLYNNQPIDLYDIMKQTRIDTKESIDALAKNTTDMLFSINNYFRTKENMPRQGLLSTDNSAVDVYENVREDMLDRFFATPYNEMYSRVRRSIENYQFDQDWDFEDDDC